MSEDDFFGLDRRRGAVEFWVAKSIVALAPYSTPKAGLVGYHPYSSCSGNTIGVSWEDGGDNPAWVGLCFGITAGATTHLVADPAFNTAAVPVNTWIHLGFVWDLDGIGGTTDQMRIYRDGSVVAANQDSFNGGVDISTCPVHVLGHHAFSRLGASLLQMDNLKVWTFAKTDFSDRWTEVSGE
jgi:hypothetical protein